MRRAAPVAAAAGSGGQQEGLHPEHPDYNKRMEDAKQRAEVAAAHFRDNPEGALRRVAKCGRMWSAGLALCGCDVCVIVCVVNE